MPRKQAVSAVLFALFTLLTMSTSAREGSLPSASLRFRSNPAPISLKDGGLQTNCADPTLIRGQSDRDQSWYVMCTSDSLSDADVAPGGMRAMHLLPILRSHDLVSWEYLGDAFARPPDWAETDALLWAPELVFRDGLYYLYYAVTDVTDAASGEPGCKTDSAIGVATSASPMGPWEDSGRAVVDPRRHGPGCDFLGTLDPDVLTTSSGERFLYYGSYYGGVEVRTLSADGLSTSAQSTLAVAIANRYEGAEVIEREGRFYLIASASVCCNGPLSGYQVFAGAADSPLGPFVDRQGVSLLDARVGGSPVLSLNGNRWVGGGHQTLFRDALGDWYAAYHAIDRERPYFAEAVGYTRRALLFDRISFDDGFPQVRHGLGASDSPQLAPLAQPPRSPSPALRYVRSLAEVWHDVTDPAAYLLWLDRVDVGELRVVDAASDEFGGDALHAKWSWVRPPSAGDLALENGALRLATQAGELYGVSNDAAVLTLPSPAGDYLVETKLELDLPDAGCCQNYVQAALLVYGSDDAYVKLSHASIWETRQTEFGKEVPAPAAGYPAYGSGVGAAPGRTTWLRIAKLTRDGADHYVSLTSRDGVNFTRGPVWTHALGSSPKIALAAFGGRGFTARFDYVRTYAL